MLKATFYINGQNPTIKKKSFNRVTQDSAFTAQTKPNNLT